MMTTDAEPADEELVRAFAKEGDAAAFGELARRYGSLVHGVARRILGEADAADLAQEVFLRLAREARRIDPARVGPWLHRTARNGALNALRKDQRRRKREEAVNSAPADEAPATPDETAVWHEGVAHLDEALDALRTEERQCVIGRYYQGMSLREVGAASGKSEDAARMTVSRALEKMSRLLRRRGVTLSATALAAGLTAELAEAAPAFAPAAVAALSAEAAAISKTAAASALPSLLTLTLMSKSTFIIATAALVFLLAAGSGYVVSRNKSKVESAAAGAASGAGSNPAIQAGGAPANAMEKSPAPAAGPQSKIERLLTRLGELWSQFKEAPRELEQSGDKRPELAKVRKVLAEVEQIQTAIQGVLKELNAEDMAAIVAAAGERYRDNPYWILGLLYERWGSINHEQAILAAKSTSMGQASALERAAVRGWAKTDPLAALAAAGPMHPKDEPGRQGHVQEVFAGWIRTDPIAAIAAYSELTPDDQMVAAHALDDVAHLPDNANATLAAIAKIPDERARAEVAEEVVEDWAKFDPEGAAAWLDSMTWRNPTLAIKPAKEIFESWSEGGDSPEPALDWFWTKLPEDGRHEMLNDFVARRWASKDRAAAEAWLQKKGIDPSKLKDWRK